MISVPPKAKTTIAKQPTNPPNPVAKNPPSDHSLLIPVPVSWIPNPKIRIATPAAIIATIAATLIRVNQNSSSPNTLTLSRLIAPMKKTIASTQIHRGTSGNQNPM